MFSSCPPLSPVLCRTPITIFINEHSIFGVTEWRILFLKKRIRTNTTQCLKAWRPIMLLHLGQLWVNLDLWWNDFYNISIEIEGGIPDSACNCFCNTSKTCFSVMFSVHAIAGLFGGCTKYVLSSAIEEMSEEKIIIYPGYIYSWGGESASFVVCIITHWSDDLGFW